MDNLYYSNYCKHSQKIIQHLSKTNIRDKINFICIDKRVREPKNNQIYIALENGTKVILPPNIHSVPALLLIKQNYRVVYGDEVMKQLEPYIMNQKDIATNRNGEPSAFHLGNPMYSSNIVSEQYTMYNMTPEELSAKGNGGSRQLYNYVSVANDDNFINTPPDTYKPDKLSNNVTIDSLQQQRNQDIPKNNMMI